MDMTNVPSGEKFCEAVAFTKRNKCNVVIGSAPDMNTQVASHDAKQKVYRRILVADYLVRICFDLYKAEQRAGKVCH
jgi:hypothetical protein